MSSDVALDQSRFDLLSLRLQVLEAKLDLLLARQAPAPPPSSPSSSLPTTPANTVTVQSPPAPPIPAAPAASAPDAPVATATTSMLGDRVQWGKLNETLGVAAKLLALPVAIMTIGLTWHKIPQLYLDDAKTTAQTQAATSAAQLADEQRAQIIALGQAGETTPDYLNAVRRIIVGGPMDALAGLGIRFLLIYAGFHAVSILTSFIELFWGWLVRGLVYFLQALPWLRASRDDPDASVTFPTREQLDQLRNWRAPARFLTLSAYAVVVALVVWPAILYTCTVLGHPNLPKTVLAALSHLDVASAARESSRIIAAP